MKNSSDLPPQDSGSRLPARRREAGPPPAAYYQLDVPPPAESPAELEPGGIVEYWRILLRRKGTVILFAVLGIIAAVLFSLPQTPIYQARGTVELLSINEDLLNKRQLDPNSPMDFYDPEAAIKTQMSILQSRTLSQRVAAKMKALYKDRRPEDTSRMTTWRKALGLAPAEPPATAAKGKDEGYAGPGCGLSVSPLAGTRLIQLLCDSSDPRFAADYVNTLANEFIDQNVEVRYQASQRTGQWLNRQLDELKIKLEKSEDELQQAARNVGLLSASDKDNIVEEKLKQVQEELSKAQADLAAKQSRFEVATSSPPEALPDILDDKVMGDLQSRVGGLRQQLAELTTTLTPQHTKVRQAQAQITELETALSKQRANVVTRIKNEYEAATRREKLLASQYAAQSKLVSGQAERSIHYTILKREVDTSRQLYDGMLQKVKEYGIASAMQASNIRIVDAAEVPRAPYKPDVKRNASLGLIAGLLLGVAFVIIRERADRSIQAPGEAALYVSAPELGVIPSATVDALQHQYYASRRFLHGRRHKRAAAPAAGEQAVELVTFQRKPSLIAESFRAVLASILFSGENGNHPRVIVMTSPAPREGKTTVVSNLGLALAEIHRRVLLIDADLRKPRLHSIFGVSNDCGLMDALKAPGPQNGQEGIVCETRYPGLYVMPAGPAEHTGLSLLYSPRLPELIERFRKEFDVILIDTPPMINMSDARVVGRLADGVILVTRAGKTTRDTLQSAAQRFAEDGTPILGTILNDWSPKKNAGYGYGYAYRSYDHYYEHYYKHYGPDPEKED